MITITDQARTKIQKLVTTKGYAGIRLGVKTTGCSGLAYVLEYVKEYEPDAGTINYAQNDFCVLVDKKHDVYLVGTQVDYVRQGLNEGILNFINNLCQQGIVPRSAIVFQTHHQQWNYDFQHKKIPLTIFFQTGSFLQGNFDSVNIDTDAKFIGCLIGRFTPNRFNLAYQLDCSFPNDNFLIFRPSIDEINIHCSLIDGAYRPEFDWAKSKTFDTDATLGQTGHTTGFLRWQRATKSYHTLWPKFQIECVAETDVFSDSWFTEKTARCLASGKPFVLFSGPSSLKTLQKFGFRTYNDVIDESYDRQLTARSRMTAMLQSLKDLYNDPDRVTKINQLNQIAKYNQVIYDKICRNFRLSTHSA